mmetsp:Transcript_112621/g.290889  ORF Transcript_112621/g.290889 Transcript_112621/m.290889 type:complete len:301 (-) Transcript_112621:571-1473(-)
MAWICISESRNCLANLLSVFSARSAACNCRCVVLFATRNVNNSRSNSEHFSACQVTLSERSASASTLLSVAWAVAPPAPPPACTFAHCGSSASNLAVAASSSFPRSTANFRRSSSSFSSTSSAPFGVEAPSLTGGAKLCLASPAAEAVPAPPAPAVLVRRRGAAPLPLSEAAMEEPSTLLSRFFRLFSTLTSRSAEAAAAGTGPTLEGSCPRARNCFRSMVRVVRPCLCAAPQSLCQACRNVNCASDKAVTQPGLRSTNTCCNPRNHWDTTSPATAKSNVLSGKSKLKQHQGGSSIAVQR